MSTLTTIKNATALHLPAPGATPVPLAHGDLHLNLLPAAPPERPTDTLIITVGASSFPLAPNSSVQRTRSKNEHPSFIFTPAPPAGGQSIGQVRIDMADSKSPEAWESTEEACKVLQAELKAHNQWEDKVLFVDDEYETGGPITGPKSGWGETIASSLWGFGSAISSRITGGPEPTLPTTAPAPIASPSSPVGSQYGQGNFRSFAADSWNQATIAAKGFGEAAVAVGGAIGQQAKHAVEGLQAPPVPPKAEGAEGATGAAGVAPPAPPKDAAAAASAPAAASASSGPPASSFSVGGDDDGVSTKSVKDEPIKDDDESVAVKETVTKDTK
ncbi:uncharacterized protein LOC62_03G003695 [Vanrija pseudolonga]|uniref:Senescence domain-containing protein n=1 Tax=Vanrija pseudolonga TaxID=143232 RepID=A0AAF0Y902_9TREE|nr:hypothetical protein LOC62_03G003695 [Vanrija pseudolonga]